MSVIGKDGCTAEETAAAVYTCCRGGQNRVEEGVLAINQRHQSHTGHYGRALPRKVNVMTAVESMADSGKTVRCSEKSVCAVVDRTTSQGGAAGEEMGHDRTQSKVWSWTAAVLAMMVRSSW